MTADPEAVFALFDDATWPDRGAVLFRQAEGLVEAWTSEDVAPALAAIDAARERGLTAAGYCAYELGYAFEPRLQKLMPQTGRPLLRFHLFKTRTKLDARQRTRWLMQNMSAAETDGVAVRPRMSANEHSAKVDQVRSLIGAGDVYQVNLTFGLEFDRPVDSFSTYASLRERSRAGACAFLRFEDEDIISFSPETFFKVSGDRIRVRPMKGTTSRAPDIDGDELRKRALACDPKQQAENLMIVDLLRNDLSRVSEPGSVEVTDLFTVETYPRFHTLTSGIEARLKPGASLSTILPALFPCGSVTGAPKIRSMEIIREVEDGARGVYCGAIGFADSDTMAFSVAIRTLTLRGETGVMGTGGGIVWDSEPAAEFDECLLKAKFLTEPPLPMRLIETMRWSDAQGFYLLDRHMARLARSCRYFGFRLDEARVRHLLGKAVAGETGLRRVRLTLGVRGDTQIEHEAFEMPAADAVWQYAIAPSAMNSGDWRVRHKTTQRSIYDEPASLLREALGCDEVLFVNERGELTEGSRTSLFIERDGIWLTPPLDSGLLDGCLRHEMLQTRPGEVMERVLFPPDLDRGQVWFGNALRGLVRGRSIQDTPASVEA